MYVILKFIVDFVDAQVVFLIPKDTATLVNFCLKLLQIYSSHNIGKVMIHENIFSLFTILCKDHYWHTIIHFISYFSTFKIFKTKKHHC